MAMLKRKIIIKINYVCKKILITYTRFKFKNFMNVLELNAINIIIFLKQLARISLGNNITKKDK